jgi:hypothetical protein
MCKQCKLKPVYEFANKRKVCGNCFIKWFQKKVFYIIRKFEMIKLTDVIGYKKQNNFRSIVLEDVLKMLCSKARVELTNGKKYNKFASPSTSDLEAYMIINMIIKGNIKNLEKSLPLNKKIIKPLYLFLDKEVLLYANLKKLSFKKENNKKNKISNFIDVLEKKHPEIKHSIINGVLKLTNK